MERAAPDSIRRKEVNEGQSARDPLPGCMQKWNNNTKSNNYRADGEGEWHCNRRRETMVWMKLKRHSSDCHKKFFSI